MTQVTFKVGNIVEEKTDGLVCSGNVNLHMSGGVNGELLSRGGSEMQKQLHQYLTKQDKKYVNPAFVMRIGPKPFHFKCIVYTVSIDVWYDSSVDLVCEALGNAFAVLQEDECSTVAVPALATGYGHLKKNDFGRALKRCLDSRRWTFQEIRVVLRDEISLKGVRKGYEAS